MPRWSIIKTLTACMLAAGLLESCSIRLPVQPKPAAHASHARTSTPAGHPPPAPDVLVWMTADKWHTGMIFPYAWLLESGFIPPAGFGHPQYVDLSWGSQIAYSKEGVNTPWKFFRVIFTPTPSVMEFIPLSWNVTEVCAHQRIWRKLVPRDRGPALAAFLNGCTATGPDGRPKVVCESSWGHGVQLQGRYHYFIPRICNVWTVQAFDALGVHINPWSALTADGLIRQGQKPPNDLECIWPGGGKPPSPVDPQSSLTPPQATTSR